LDLCRSDGLVFTWIGVRDIGDFHLSRGCWVVTFSDLNPLLLETVQDCVEPADAEFGLDLDRLVSCLHFRFFSTGGAEEGEAEGEDCEYCFHGLDAGCLVVYFFCVNMFLQVEVPKSATK
ncbi:MAG: hypothetical protein RIQ72_222, partial [Candidatus Parcubacteria bacterium]